MFGRGNWAIVGLAKESLEAFRTSLEDQTIMVASSQMAASAITRHLNADALGINPFSAPRLDEEHTVELDHQQELARYATLEQAARSSHNLSAEILDCEGYGVTVEQFQLHPEMPWYGLWAVSNERKDVSDLASIKEQRSYVLLERPYKFLQATDKKSVDQETLGVPAAVRKQVPVLLDFNDGRVYIESTSPKLIEGINERLRELGVGIISVAWTYNLPNWPAQILNKLYEGTQYHDDFQKRADEATRFKASEIEKLEDKELESIVAHYFSMTQLPSDLWIGISGPAQIRLHDASSPIGVKSPTSATTLLNMTDDATVISGAITFQERVSTSSKKFGERTFRKDLLCIDVNDRINLTDAGAAMLRGFNIPAFRKDLQREIRETKQVPSIEQFWGNWLHEMSNAVRTIEAAFRELLDIDGNQEAGILPMRAQAEDEVPELVSA
ncbi:MAG TPA: hypothetical protein VNH18_03425 [Bryobacteraceae bacterium]|nr:hypothetical protein [Bryobacteraceae bacterium]